jgi:hypothetical protein
VADGDAGRCEPYRVEWRPALEADWIVGWHRETLGEAEDTSRQLVVDYGGQARVMEQRVVLVRGLGQDGGPDQAFADFASRNLTAAARQAADTMATADGVVRASQASRMFSSEPEESEQAMPDGLLFSERELWDDTRTWAPTERRRVREVLARLDRVRAAQRRRPTRDTDLRDALAHIARVTVWLADDPADRVAYLQDVARDAIRPSVVSDPDDRRDVEAAADAGEPLDQARTILNQLADTDTQRQAIRDATVTDTAGCGHRMTSGAVSLTACGECGAEPGDDCADPLEDRERWALEHTDTTSVTPNDVRRAREAVRRGVLAVGTAHRDLDDFGVPRHLSAAEPEQTATEDPCITELREAAMRAGEAFTFGPVDEIEAARCHRCGHAAREHAMSGTCMEPGCDCDQLTGSTTDPHGTDPWWRRLLHRPRQ